MNERIKELIKQATTREEFYPAGCNGYPEYRYDFNKEKFAELIVKECAEVCFQHSQNAGEDTAFGFGYKECGDDIKKIFGVEQ